MYKYVILAVMFLGTGMRAVSFTAPAVHEAVGLAYNFQFREAELILDDFQRRNPDDSYGDMGRIVFNFLLINQNPARENFESMYEVLSRAEEKVEDQLKNGESKQLDFYQCFINYYYMKSYALEDRWLRAMSYGVKARRGAVALQDYTEKLPDLYYILGDQDYSASLVPGHLRPLLRPLNFTPDRAGGLDYIRTAVDKGELTRAEASIMYISSNIYVEGNYSRGMEMAERFLREFPENLTVKFFFIDLLLRTERADEASRLLNRESGWFDSKDLTGKWVPRYIQMKGNLLNARKDYPGAIALYRQALEYPEISAYSATEILLEMGKLLDILGRRREAVQVYRECASSSGLELHKEEAKNLRRTPHDSPRGSY